MQAIPLAHIPRGLREFILTNVAETYRAVETLKVQYMEAFRRKDDASASRAYVQLAELCWPENPPIRVFGGEGGSFC